MKSGKVTIDEVAREAGVSKTTVSRYLNGRYDKIAEPTRERIAAAVEKLGFRPNRIAQSLKSHRSGQIGCVIGDISNPFSSIMIKGVNSICTPEGYQVLLVDSGNDPESERRSIAGLIESQVDGLIINSTGKNDEYILELSKETPIVLADRRLTIPGEIDTVETDNEQVIAKSLKYLKDFGYRRVGFFGPDTGDNETRALRHQVFCREMRELFDLDGEALTYLYGQEEGRDCRSRVQEFVLSATDEPLCLMAVNGVALLDVVRAILSMGLVMGRDVGVFGFDNWGWADLIAPGITTITQDSHRVGEEAARILLSRIREEDKDPATEKIHEILPNILEVRGSTAPLGRG